MQHLSNLSERVHFECFNHGLHVRQLLHEITDVFQQRIARLCVL